MRHHADLPFEGEMIGVLRDGDADRKLRGVATTEQDLRGPGRRHDRTVTPASILLADVVFDLIRQLDGGDPLSFCGCEFVPNLHDRQRRLRARAMPGLRRPLRPRR